MDGKDGKMEYIYRKNQSRKKLRLKKKPAIIILLIVAIIIAGLFWFLIREDKYDKYRNYDEENKQYGEIKHYEQDDDQFFISLYYPKTDNKNLNQLITDYKDEFLKNQEADKKEKNVLYMDYSIEKIFKQYVNLIISTQRYDEDDKVVSESTKIISYDTKNEKVLTVRDALRNNYKISLSAIDGIDELEDKSENLTVEKDKLVIYPNADLSNKIEINYEDNKDLIKLANKNIPSNAPLDVQTPAATPEVDPNKKMIAFTLDDGPHKTNTLRVVELFEKYNGRATFFQLGKNIQQYSDVVKTVYEHGFEIASHSWDHPDLRKLDDAGLNQQIKDTQDIIFSITGDEPVLIRPPYGAFNDNVKTVIHSNDMQIALWSVDTLDWKLKDANKIKDAIVSSAYDGAVILLHDIHNFSVDGLELALAELSNQGYQFVSLSTLSQYKELKTVLR